MKLTIDLDMNKIDYDAINKQVIEQISQLNIENDYAISTRINEMIKKYVDDGVTAYIQKYWQTPTQNCKNVIEAKTKSIIECRVKQILEKVFDETYNNEEFTKLLEKMIPNVFTTILFSIATDNIESMRANGYSNTYSMIQGEIASFAYNHNMSL